MTKRKQQGRRKSRRFISFLLCVAIPTAAGSYYVSEIMADRYVSEARFSVKSEGPDISSAVSLGILGSSGGPSKQDQLMIRDYIRSLDMVRTLQDKYDEDLSKDLRSPEKRDILWALPETPSKEEILERWRDMVEVTYDENGAITTVRVEAFDPATAHRLASEVVEEARSFVNALSQKIAKQYINFAEREVHSTRRRLDDALQTLNAFQEENRMLDPESDAETLMKLIGELEAERATAMAEAASLRTYMSPDHPKVKAVKARVSDIDEQIDQVRSRLAGASGSGISETLSQFIKLKSDLEFAERTYRAALTALESARSKALQEQKHLMTVVAPALPEDPEYPRDLTVIGSLLCLLLIARYLIILFTAIIREHISPASR